MVLERPRQAWRRYQAPAAAGTLLLGAAVLVAYLVAGSRGVPVAEDAAPDATLADAQARSIRRADAQARPGASPIDAAALRARQATILSSPPGAVVRLDGVRLGVTPVTRRIPTRAGRLTIGLRGYHTWTRRVPPGVDALRISIHLKPMPGRLYITTKTADGAPIWADVLLDGRPVGRTPLTIRAAAGRHRLVIRRSGFSTFSKMIRVRPGRRTTEVIQLQSP
jgi:hypothetical protein